MRKNLEELQLAMRQRHTRPKRTHGPSKAFRRQRRIFTLFRLRQGWSVYQIADFLNATFPKYPVDPRAILRWTRRGCPI
jgi:hypothetical protein